jgi:hypothetical protein
MAMRIYARRVDANQKRIVEELRSAGFTVEPINGKFDLAIGFAGISLLCEIKNPKGRDRLQPSQEQMYEEWKGSYLIARTTGEIIRWFAKQLSSERGRA